MGQEPDVLVQDLAVALGVSVPALLQRADDIIEKQYQQGGLESIRGLTTGTRKVGGMTLTTVSPALAERLRTSATSS